MIYPTRAAVLIAAGGALFALFVAGLWPNLWLVGLAWPLAVLLLVAADALNGAQRAEVRITFPPHLYVGDTGEVAIRVNTRRRSFVKAIDIALGLPRQIEAEDEGRAAIAMTDGEGSGLLPVSAMRRGEARFDRLWLRWPGPLGLAWHQQEVPLQGMIPILPDVRPIHQHGASIFQRRALQGLIAQQERGDGSDFDALIEFQRGMDKRSIDWKQSARHLKLHARQYRSERNNQIVFAIDSGRQMSEPVGGLPRVDRAVSSALLTAWVALKMGDRVALHSFDSRPRLASGLVSGAGAFTELQRMAAGIDYSGEETNYTFALTTLGARLTRRSMIILFTEFTDMISADFMIRAVRRLTQTHLVLVIVLRDEELEGIVGGEPKDAGDVVRAITAADLLKERRVVLARLQQLGVHVIESGHEQLGQQLLHGYLELKRRNLL